MRSTALVSVEVDVPHPWTPGIERFRPDHLWLFYGTKLERARRALNRTWRWA